jgi:hypothetical protein
MGIDREHKNIVNDYVKSITHNPARHVIEWTAADLQEFDHDCFSVESIFKDDSIIHKFLTKNYSVLIWYTKRSIRLGKVFLRAKKIDPSKPVRYRENGWAIRNQSTRADKTAYGRSMSLLSIRPTFKSRILNFLKHR